MSPTLKRSVSIGALLLGALSWLSPSTAEACGGMFCDGGPQSMPVDQKGENILYAVDTAAETVEAHIQIQYQGEASRFAWVLPVQNLPTFEVGSQLLFTSLLQGTVPSYGFSNQFTCSNGPFPGGGTGGSSASGGQAGSGAGGNDGEGPKVVLQKTVGAFDVVVLQGGSAAEVVQWLNDNNYQQNPAAEPILQQYLEQNYLFAAIKLTGGAGVDEIHPLVVKYHGTQPCIPLKLTAIAATEDMGVRAFVLGDKRWVPAGGYKHVVLNPARFNWPAQVANYNDVVIKGTDSAVADGRAFITEYAGPSSVVSTFSVYSESWQSGPFKMAKPEQVVGLLNQQGLFSCFNNGGPAECFASHPLLQGILDEFLPAPADVSPSEFYSCLSCYSDQIDQTKWDGEQFAARLDERVIAPGKHAAELVKTWPYLTRMFTAISPAEMTSDPEFHPRDGLPDVAAGGIATQRFECAHTVMALPDQRNIALPQSGGWVPWPDEMPWAERIEEIPETGDAVVLVDNTQKIDDLIDAWNKSQGWPPAETGGSAGVSQGGGGNTPGTGGSGAATGGQSQGTGGSTSGTSGAPGAGGTGGVATGGTGGVATGGAGGVATGGTGGAGGAVAAKPPEPAGGGCQLGNRPGAPAGWLWAVGLAAGVLARRRKGQA